MFSLPFCLPLFFLFCFTCLLLGRCEWCWLRFSFENSRMLLVHNSSAHTRQRRRRTQSERLLPIVGCQLAAIVTTCNFWWRTWRRRASNCGNAVIDVSGKWRHLCARADSTATMSRSHYFVFVHYTDLIRSSISYDNKIWRNTNSS